MQCPSLCHHVNEKLQVEIAEMLFKGFIESVTFVGIIVCQAGIVAAVFNVRIIATAPTFKEKNLQKLSITESTDAAIQFPDGSSYVGNVLNGTMHGRGIWTSYSNENAILSGDSKTVDWVYSMKVNL